MEIFFAESCAKLFHPSELEEIDATFVKAFPDMYVIESL